MRALPAPAPPGSVWAIEAQLLAGTTCRSKATVRHEASECFILDEWVSVLASVNFEFELWAWLPDTCQPVAEDSAGVLAVQAKSCEAAQRRREIIEQVHGRVRHGKSVQRKSMLYDIPHPRTT